MGKKQIYELGVYRSFYVKLVMMFLPLVALQILSVFSDYTEFRQSAGDVIFFVVMMPGMYALFFWLMRLKKIESRTLGDTWYRDLKFLEYSTIMMCVSVSIVFWDELYCKFDPNVALETKLLGVGAGLAILLTLFVVYAISIYRILPYIAKPMDQTDLVD